jgi:hypothetical protein
LQDCRRVDKRPKRSEMHRRLSEGELRDIGQVAGDLGEIIEVLEHNEPEV